MISTLYAVVWILRVFYSSWHFYLFSYRAHFSSWVFAWRIQAQAGSTLLAEEADRHAHVRLRRLRQNVHQEFAPESSSQNPHRSVSVTCVTRVMASEQTRFFTLCMCFIALTRPNTHATPQLPNALCALSVWDGESTVGRWRALLFKQQVDTDPCWKNALPLLFNTWKDERHG